MAQLVLERHVHLRGGDVVLTLEYDDPFPLEQRLFERIQSDWHLTLLEQQGRVSAWLVVARGRGGSG